MGILVWRLFPDGRMICSDLIQIVQAEKISAFLYVKFRRRNFTNQRNGFRTCKILTILRASSIPL